MRSDLYVQKIYCTKNMVEISYCKPHPCSWTLKKFLGIWFPKCSSGCLRHATHPHEHCAHTKSGTLSSVYHREETMQPTTRVAAVPPPVPFLENPRTFMGNRCPVSEYTFSAKGRRGHGHLDYIYERITPVFIGFLSCLDNVRPHTCTKGIVFCFSTNLRENSF